MAYRCTFSANNSRSEGGAIYNEGALTVDASTFTENGAAINGHLWTAGGIFNKGGTTVTNSTFSANSTDCGVGREYFF